MPNPPRPTLSDLASQTAAGDPWVCRMGDCRDWRVADSRLRATGVRRRLRICRHCGEPLTTIELPITRPTLGEEP